MKKLIAIIGATLMCSVASAAAVLWSASETFADSTGAGFSDTRNIAAYLFDTGSVSQDALFSSWKAGAANVAGAKVTSTWYDAYQLDVTAEVGSSGSKALFWAVVNGDDLFISSVDTQDISAIGVTTFEWADESGRVFANPASFSGAGWYTAAPEPTSGLLLLLGMAGLALRRKRA